MIPKEVEKFRGVALLETLNGLVHLGSESLGSWNEGGEAMSLLQNTDGGGVATVMTSGMNLVGERKGGGISDSG